MVKIDGIDSPEQLREQEDEATTARPSPRYDFDSSEPRDDEAEVKDSQTEPSSESPANDENKKPVVRDEDIPDDDENQKKPAFAERVRGTLKKRQTKIWLAAGGGGMAGLIILIIILILIGLFKIPNLAANITQYEFVGLTRQLSRSAERISAEAVAVQAADEGTIASGATAAKPGGLYGDLKARFYDPYVASAKGKLGPVAEVWDNLNSFRPSQIIDNLNTNHGFTFTVRKSAITGRQVLRSITLDGVEYSIKPGGIQGWTPVWKDIVAANRYKALEPELMKALGVGGDETTVGLLIRGAKATALRSQMGIPLKAWVLSEFIGKDAKSARLIEVKQKATAINEPANVPDNAATQELSDGVKAADEAEKQVLDDSEKLQKAINNQGMAKEVDNAIGSAVQDSWTKGVIDFINPVYGIVLPICIVYDGSVQQSQPTIDNQTHQQMAGYYYIASAADQQKYGNPPGQGTAQATATQATNDDLGDTGNSIPIIRANGGTVDTTVYTSAEAGAGGAYYYDVYSALGVSPASQGGKDLHAITSTMCGVLTNTATAVGIGIVNVAGAIITFGGSEAAEEAVGQGAAAVIRTFVEKTAKDILRTQVEKQGAKVIERTALSRAARFLFKQGIIVGATVGATELANYIVASRAHQVNGGLTQGNDLAVMADAGGNIVKGEIARAQIFARPMTNEEVGQSDSADAQTLAYQNSTKSFSDRYFALSNVHSLTSRFMIAADSMLQPTIGTSFADLIGTMLSPARTFSSLFNIFGVAKAAPDPRTQHYGNVQFGWSEAENKLIDSDSSYLPLQNQLILDQSGQADAIAREYHACFGYDYVNGNGNLNPTDPSGNLQLNINGDGSLGHLLADANIVRNQDGTIVSNEGLCSPLNLGVSNPRYGDMVLRWRLAMSYDTTINQLNSMQTVTN